MSNNKKEARGMDHNTVGYRAWVPLICGLFVVLFLAGCNKSGSGSFSGDSSSSDSSGFNEQTGGGSLAATARNPEPSTMLLFATGIAGLVGAAFKNRKKNKS
jgi:hypothetical protein